MLFCLIYDMHAYEESYAVHLSVSLQITATSSLWILEFV